MSEDQEKQDRQALRESGRDDRTGRGAAAERIRNQTRWVDLQVQRAMERGEFDDLPGYGKPIEDLGTDHDPDWWVKKLVEREQISLLPPALAVRKEDAELDGRLDRLTAETEVRREVEGFNERVRAARLQLLGGPPVITPLRDVDAEVAAWRDRRTARVEAQRAALATRPQPERRRLFRRRR